jgi:tellurite resistance protein TehA-like permease
MLREGEMGALIFLGVVGFLYAVIAYLVTQEEGFTAGFWAAVGGCVVIYLCGIYSEREVREW